MREDQLTVCGATSPWAVPYMSQWAWALCVADFEPRSKSVSRVYLHGPALVSASMFLPWLSSVMDCNTEVYGKLTLLFQLAGLAWNRSLNQDMSWFSIASILRILLYREAEFCQKFSWGSCWIITWPLSFFYLCVKDIYWFMYLVPFLYP